MSEKRAILLVRVSTEKQDYQAQITSLERKLEQFGITEYKTIETKETGLADLNSKKGVNELFEFIKNNPSYNTVLTTEISRLGRRQSVLQYIKEWFVTNKVQLYVEDIDFNLLNERQEISQMGEMAFTMYALFAEAEIKAKKDRFIRKRKDLMKNGFASGGKVLFGYQVENSESQNKKLIRHPKHADNVRTIFNWYLKGIVPNTKTSVKQIAMECMKGGFPEYTHSKRNVNKLLKEEGYTGYKITHNKRKNPKFGLIDSEPEYIVSTSEMKFPPIISKEKFEKVQVKLRERRAGSRSSKHQTILANLIQCPSCKCKLGANYRYYNEQDKSSYRCTSRSSASPCKNKQSIGLNLIDSSIWSLIKSDFQLLIDQVLEQNPNINLVELKQQITNINTRIASIQEEVKLVTDSLIHIKKLSNINFSDFAQKQQKKLEKLDKEQGQLDLERLRIENEVVRIETTVIDQVEYNDTYIKEIEGSKELVKKYVNILVNGIEVLEHETTHTLLKVTFNRSNIKFNPVENISLVRLGDTNIEPMFYAMFLLIDKRVTRKIKLTKSMYYSRSLNFDEEITSVEKIRRRLIYNPQTRKNQTNCTVDFFRI